MRIGYYICSRTKGRNARYPIHVLYAYNADWPESVLAARGLCGNRVWSRAAFPHEVGVRTGSYRAVSYGYESLDALLADEDRAGCTMEQLDMLAAVITRGLPRIRGET